MNTCTTCECIDNNALQTYNKVVNTSLNKACSFFCHRKTIITEELVCRMRELLKSLIVECNVQTFYFGGFSTFDEVSYNIVSELKQNYPNIKRVFCLYDPRHIRESKRPLWIKNQLYEEYIYLRLRFDWWYTRLYYRNLEIINRSDYVVVYAEEKEESGAYKALQYAIKKNKKIYNLFNDL